MSAVATEWPAFNWPMGRKIADWTIASIVFLGAFVVDEPAPYELLLCPIIVVWACFGLKINRHFMPMVVLLLLYAIGGLLALTQLADPNDQVLYVATSIFLVISAIFFAAVIAEAPERRLRLITRAYVASAIVASLVGIAGYFELLPPTGEFLRYDRLKGTFQDPNVFGPFLVLPIALLFQQALTNRLSRSWRQIGFLLIILFAEFLAFSRAAWGMTVFAMLLVAFFVYLNEPRQTARFRIVAYLVAGAMVAALMVAVALSVPAISDLFAQRAFFVEDYDAGRLGRFSRHVLGFFLVQEHPLGIGPLEFAKFFGEDEHNMWLKGFTTYGWLGGFAYIALVLWTLVAATPLLFKPRPWQPILQCAFAVYLGHLMIHNVIDNDHWRHLFLLYGILWGTIAAEKMYVRSLRQAGLRPVADVLPPALAAGGIG